MNNAKNTTLFPYLERLLEGEKVEWKTLGDKEYISIENNARKAVNSMSRIPGNTPYYGANNIQDYVEGYTHDGVYILIAEDGTASVEQYSIQWAEGKFWANNHVHVIKGTEKINNRFLYYFLKTVNYTPFLKGGGRAKLTKAKLQEIPFAVPPLRVQARIVEILDKFTQLEAELEAELEARRKQYAYYRDQLLNFSQYPPLNVNIEWRMLGEVGTFYRGTSFQKKDFTSEGVGCIHYGEIYTHYGVSAQDTISKLSAKKANNARKANYGDLIIATTSENDEDVCKSVAWLGNESIVVSNDACYYQHALDPKYVAYFFLTNDFQQQKRAFITGAKVRRVNPRDLAKIIIPIPPLSEQRRIVDILDRFDTLTNSISEGLPKEIALRRKQYEYYRDALLNFPRAEVTA